MIRKDNIAVNNAGYALTGPFEETSMEETRAQFETNLFGAVRVMQGVIPIVRKQESGRIVNITSMRKKDRNSSRLYLSWR